MFSSHSGLWDSRGRQFLSKIRWGHHCIATHFCYKALDTLVEPLGADFFVKNHCYGVLWFCKKKVEALLRHCNNAICKVSITHVHCILKKYFTSKVKLGFPNFQSSNLTPKAHSAFQTANNWNNQWPVKGYVVRNPPLHMNQCSQCQPCPQEAS